MRASIAAISLVLLALAAAGCGRSQSEPAPAACREGAGGYVSALADAPGAVKLSGGVPISECLTENQEGGDLATVGEAMVAAATKLSAAARDEPGGAASLELGYLVGAAQRGADQTEGIHTDLVRRLTVAARYSPEGPLPAAFLSAYRRGYNAGHSGG
jgi:hypothetical protein